MIQIETGATDAGKPTVLIENIWANGNLFVSNEAPDGEAENAIDGLTYDFWTPASIVTQVVFRVDFGGPTYSANCLGIAAHDLGTKGIEFDLDYHDGVSWTTIATHEPTDDSTILIMFPQVTGEEFRLVLRGTQVFSIGVTMLGNKIALPGIVGDYEPTNWADEIELLGGKSISGQFMEQRVLEYGAATSVSLGRVDRSWFDTTGRTFARYYNEGRHFFFAGWPDTLQDDVAFCRRGEGMGEIRGTIVDRNYVAISFDVSAYATA